MDCNVIKDLMPLYIDECCSKKSGELVEEHIAACPECKSFFESMKAPSDVAPVVTAPKKMKKLNDWKASVLQSVLLFISFAVITLGVYFESKTASGSSNGLWAFSVVIPATGFMLSLANWYFVRLYKSRKCFSASSLLVTLAITTCAYIWSCFHYQINIKEIIELAQSVNTLDVLEFTVLSPFFWSAVLPVVASCTLSKLLSNLYAKMIGKE